MTVFAKTTAFLGVFGLLFYCLFCFVINFPFSEFFSLFPGIVQTRIFCPCQSITDGICCRLWNRCFDPQWKKVATIGNEFLGPPNASATSITLLIVNADRCAFIVSCTYTISCSAGNFHTLLEFCTLSPCRRIPLYYTLRYLWVSV